LRYHIVIRHTLAAGALIVGVGFSAWADQQEILETSVSSVNPHQFAVDYSAADQDSVFDKKPIGKTVSVDKGLTDQNKKATNPSAGYHSHNQAASKTSAITITVPLMFAESYLGDIAIQAVPGETEASIDVKRFHSLTKDIFKDEYLARISGLAASSDGFASLNQFLDMDIMVEFDQSRVELVLKKEGNAIAPIELSFSGYRGLYDSEDLVRPAGFSGFVNIRPSLTYRDETEDDEGLDPLLVGFDGALATGGLGGYAIQFLVDYDNGAQFHPWQRRETRLIHDILSSLVQTSLGDLDYSVVGFQDFISSGGIAAERNFDIEPGRVTRVTGQNQFNVLRSSSVEIFVNGRLQSRRRLEPGDYDLRDFPLVSGTNEVRIVATDAAGRKTVIEFTSFFDADLLEVDEYEFLLTGGFPSSFEEDRVRYETSRQFVSTFYRRGLSKSLTAGVNFQTITSPSINLIGTDIVWTGWFGAIASNLAVSFANKFSADYAFDVDYQKVFRNAQGNTLGTFDLSLERFGKNFATGIDTSAPDRPNAWSLSGRYTHYPTSSITVTLDARHTHRRAREGNENRVGVTVSKRFVGGHSLQVTGEWKDENQESDLNLFVSFFMNLDSRKTLSGSYDTDRQSSRLEWQYNGKSQIGGVDIRAGYDYMDDTTLFSEFDYRHNRFEVSLRHDLLLDGISTSSKEQTTLINPAMAIAFADDLITIGRPVANSFAIADRSPTLGNRQVSISPGSQGDRSRITRLPGLIHDMTPYEPTLLPYTVEDLPVGYDLGASQLAMIPGFLIGNRVTVGSESPVTVMGTILAPDGSKISLAGGKVTLIEEEEVEPLSTFTNRGGRFVIQGVTAGKRYLLEFPQGTIEIDIPDDANGLVETGTITLEGK